MRPFHVQLLKDMSDMLRLRKEAERIVRNHKTEIPEKREEDGFSESRKEFLTRMSNMQKLRKRAYELRQKK